MIHFFASSSDLRKYVELYNEITWHGFVGLGSLEFIDSDIHVVFDSRQDYEQWLRDGQPVQFCLF